MEKDKIIMVKTLLGCQVIYIWKSQRKKEVTFVKTLKGPKNFAVYADNFLASLAVAEYLLSNLATGVL